MSEMKLIMERWDGFLLSENLEQLKDNPAETADLIEKIPTITDRDELQNLLNTLTRDPEIADLIKSLGEIENEQGLQEGELSDKILKTYVQGDIAVQNFLDTPTGQKVKKYGLPVLALALGALKLHQGGALDPEEVEVLAKMALNKISTTDLGGAVVDAMGTGA